MSALFRISSLVLFICFGELARSQSLLINEILVNPPGTDNPFEFIELKGTPGTVINNTYLVVLESDSGSKGNCDFTVRLNGITLGSTGLYLIATSLGYSVPTGTILRDTLVFGIPGGYLENGSTTFALFYTTTPFVTNFDYDADNNGILELPPGAALLDAVGWTNGSASSQVFGNVALTQAAGTPDAAVRFFGNNDANTLSAWYCGDLNGTAPNFTFDLLEVSANFPTGGKLSPGRDNYPNPAGIEGHETNPDFLVYPSLTRDMVNISTSGTGGGGQIPYVIYNAIGEICYSGTLINSTSQIDVSIWPDGCYFISCSFEHYMKMKKFVKI